MKKNIRALQNTMLLGGVLLALALVYRQIIRADALLSRGDNPRLVIAEQRVKRGKIVTAQGVPLAETLTTPDGLTRRHYPYPNLATVTGYYSLRYGTGGLEAAFDPILRGENRQTWLDDVMHRPPVGQTITVTIHLGAQIAADTALARAKATGAVVVLDAVSGEVLVLAGRPTFDPNHLEAEWDILANSPQSPLLNRATQGLFPLGDMVRLVGLIGLSEAGTTIPLNPLEAPLSAMLAPLSGQGLAATARQLRLAQELPFVLPVSAGYLPDDLPAKAPEIAITPLHLAVVMAAVAQDGLAPAPTLAYTRPPTASTRLRLFSPATARRMSNTVSEYSALVPPEITGSAPLSWYWGIVRQPRPLVVVAVATMPGATSDTARAMALAALNALTD